MDPDTWCISLETIEKAITPRTRAIMPVHVFGRPAPMTEIVRARQGPRPVRDRGLRRGARRALRRQADRLVLGDIASFSFFGNKIITTGEGGICVTGNAELAASMRMLRDHGMRPDRRYWHEEPGFNFRMTNLQAAIGCAQLERMDELLAMRREVARACTRPRSPTYRAITLPPPMSARCEPVVWFSCALTPAEKRPALIAACRDANIDLRPFFHGLSSMPAYRRLRAPVSGQLALSRCRASICRPRARWMRGVAGKIADIFRGVLQG